MDVTQGRRERWCVAGFRSVTGGQWSGDLPVYVGFGTGPADL